LTQFNTYVRVSDIADDDPDVTDDGDVQPSAVCPSDVASRLLDLDSCQCCKK